MNENRKTDNERQACKISANKLLQMYKFRNITAFQLILFNEISVPEIEETEHYHQSHLQMLQQLRADIQAEFRRSADMADGRR